MVKKALFLILPVLCMLNLNAQEPVAPVLDATEKAALHSAPQAAETTPPAPSAASTPKVNTKDSTPQQNSLESEKGTRMNLVTIGLSKEHQQTAIDLLKKLQADEFTLYLKTWQFHWNVTGMNFNDLHGLFLKQYEQLNTFVDDVAERIRALGGIAIGTQADFLALTRLKEEAGVPSAKEMIKQLLEDHEAIIRSLRADIDATAKIDDMGTNNFLSDLITKHEKTAWMLRAYLEA